MIRSTGWLPDLRDTRDKSVRELFGQTPHGSLPTPDLLRYRQGILRQLGTNCCVGFAFARALHINLLARGFAGAPIPSPAFLYYNGRLAEQEGVDASERRPVEDRGSFPRLVMQGSRGLGYCPETDWPFSETIINRQPKIKAYHRAIDQKDLGFYRIYGDGQTRVDAADEALRRGAGLLFGMTVDQAFMDHTGSSIVTTIGESMGKHMMTVLAHERQYGSFLIDNWWGVDWGFDGGIGRISEDLFGSDLVGDVYAVHAAALYSR